MIQKFIESGYEIVDFAQCADIYIVNTCTVTSISDKKSRQILRRAKSENNNSIVVAVGCYAQIAKKELEKIDEIDLILGTNEKNDIVFYIEKYINDKNGKIENVSDIMKQKDYIDFGDVTFSDKTREVVKIEDGCDRFCSYCIIPYARGRVRSRDISSIINEIKKIANNGVKEIVLTGIHIASYGKDLKNGIGLIDVLEKINEIDGIERIRLGSIEPTIIDKNFVNRIIKLEKVCNHFHLSLQSACNETLKRMNRRYTIEEFCESIKLLRVGYRNDIALTTDVIVGFPGETELEFEETYNNLKKINFNKMHVFKYSPRIGTKAASMNNQIDPKTKEERSKKIIELSNNNEIKYIEQYIGKNVKVLFEKVESNMIWGHTTNYMKVAVNKDKDFENKICNVRIEKRQKDRLIGIVI